MSKSIHVCKSYSMPNVGRFLRHGVDCSLISCYLAKRLKTEEPVFNSFLYYFNIMCPNLC